MASIVLRGCMFAVRQPCTESWSLPPFSARYEQIHDLCDLHHALTPARIRTLFSLRVVKACEYTLSIPTGMRLSEHLRVASNSSSKNWSARAA